MNLLVSTKFNEDLFKKHPIFKQRHDFLLKKFQKFVKDKELCYYVTLDPVAWKEHDHYLILGLENLRHNADDEDIKRAYRRKVLLHHPDKNKTIKEPNYFPCIVKAYEILSDIGRRRSYDSIDPTFDNAIPENYNFLDSKSDVKIYQHFYQEFHPVFERNSRWSFNQPVPMLGLFTASKEYVESFYDFWYNFESWREYSYLDEEDKSKGENREERRWIEKQNKVKRNKLKKDEVNRIRKLVDLAYKHDIRVLRIKQEEKRQKLAYKMARQQAAQIQSSNDNNQDGYFNGQQNPTKEDEIKKAVANEMSAKEAQLVKEHKREKKKFNQFITSIQESIYGMMGFKENYLFLEEMDKLLHWLNLTDLKTLNTSLETNKDDFTQLNNILTEQLKLYQEYVDREKMSHIKTTNTNNSIPIPQNGTNLKTCNWTLDELKHLVKATELYPVGTNDRWEQITAYVCKRQLSGDKPKTSRDIIARVKTLSLTTKQKLNTSHVKPPTVVSEESTNIVNNSSTQQDSTQTNETLTTNAKWSKKEQKLLEQGIRTMKLDDPQRWQTIADLVGTKNKLQCMMRYKELAEMLKLRKQQQK